jgi:quinoprotein glucose dehydrogenase
MPPNNDLSQADVTALLAFLENPGPAVGRGGRGGAPAGPITGPVVASGGAPGARGGAGRGAGGMTDYPVGLDVPSARYTTGYGLSNTIVKPPYSTLTAYDLNTGTIQWQVPAGGDDPRAVADGGRDTGFVSERSGMISTSTGLLFHASGAGTVSAYDVDNGRKLWTARLPAGSRGVPAMYEVDGRQYLVVNAGQGIQDPTSGGRAYVVFGLPR